MFDFEQSQTVSPPDLLLDKFSFYEDSTIDAINGGGKTANKQGIFSTNNGSNDAAEVQTEYPSNSPSSPTTSTRRPSFNNNKVRHPVANTASATGRAAKKLVRRTIQGGIKTTKSAVNMSHFRNQSSDENEDSSIRSSLSEQLHTRLETKVVLLDIERLAQNSGTNTEQEHFKVVPSYAIPKPNSIDTSYDKK